MGMTLETQLLLLCIFFLTLDTVAVGLRLYVRLRLKSASFGWDDVFLTITYVSPACPAAALEERVKFHTY